MTIHKTANIINTHTYLLGCPLAQICRFMNFVPKPTATAYKHIYYINHPYKEIQNEDYS